MRFEPVPSDTNADLLGVCMLGERSAVAVGRGGTVLRGIDGRWRLEDAGTDEDLYAVRFACGLAGALLELPATPSTSATDSAAASASTSAPAALSTITTAHLTSVAVQGSDLVVVGFDGTLIRRANATWRVLRSGTREHLWSSCASSAGAFAVGANGTMLAITGTAASRIDTTTTADLHGVAACGTSVIAVGRGGTIVCASSS